MQKFKSKFESDTAIIGVIHVQALPGTPKNSLEPNAIIDHAIKEATIYKDAGIDAIMIENMHDVPYLKGSVGHEITALMTLIGHEVKSNTQLNTGIQILAAANKEALAAAKAANLDFIRAEGFVFAHTADEGIIESQAGELLRYRKQIGADHISVYTDIKKKHSAHALTQDITLLETANAARFFLSDGVIVTGNHTGIPPNEVDLKILKEHLDFPVIIGSGMSIENAKIYLPICDAMIVGSHFKAEGFWENELVYDKVARFMAHIKG
ncbi:MAG: BtpA/SgcQ family protein [Bacteroidia bacterium]|nr:BtpA/SgcQ family protein [Bacteroidia bacterium]